jgi:membrane protease YdiL (CAAX protease family)
MTVSPTKFVGLIALAVAALSVVFGFVADKWLGMTVAMGLLLAVSLSLPAARGCLKPSLMRIATGLATGIALYGISVLSAAVIFQLRPEWIPAARLLYSWKSEHSPLFITTTLVMIVLAEEVLWRGVVAQFLMKRWGRVTGVALAAAIYAVAHLAAGNPLLVIAAFGCGLYWGLLYAATDDLVTPAVSHLVWDVLLLFVFPVV